MSLSAEAYNRLRGPGLTIRVMDIIREHHANGTPLTGRQIARQLSAFNSLDKEQFGKLYIRIRGIIKGFEDAGLINIQPGYDKVTKVRLIHITLTTPTPSPCSD